MSFSRNQSSKLAILLIFAEVIVNIHRLHGDEKNTFT